MTGTSLQSIIVVRRPPFLVDASCYHFYAKQRTVYYGIITEVAVRRGAVRAPGRSFPR